MGWTRQQWFNLLPKEKIDANFFKMYLDFADFAV